MMKLDDRLLAYEDQEMTIGNNMDGALLVREARERIIQLESEVDKWKTEANRLYGVGQDIEADRVELEAENEMLRKKHHPDCNIFITGTLDMPEPNWCTCGYEQLEAENERLQSADYDGRQWIGELKADNARLRELIDMFTIDDLNGIFNHYMEMQKQAIHGQSGESVVNYWKGQAGRQLKIIDAFKALEGE